MPRPEATPRGSARRPACPWFAPALARLAERLDLAPAAKSRVLIEMRADLEALYEHHRARGCPPSIARELAEERVLPSEEALAALVGLHASPLVRWLDGLSGRLRRGWEFLAAGTVLAAAFGGAAWIVLRVGFLFPPSPFLWPVLALGGACLAGALPHGWALFVRNSARAAAGRTLPLYLVAGAAAVLVGAAGLVLGLHGTALAAAGGGLAAGDLLGRLARDAALLATALAVTFCAGGAWFLFANRAAALRRAELAFLRSR